MPNERVPVLPLSLLGAATLACLVPFLGKAFHIDDPLFVWTARHLQSAPFDFYGFNLNWEGWLAPMATVTQNPPLAAYYMALTGSVVGWSEAALHAGFLLPALAVVLGTYYLARRFCSHPSWAALVVVTAPVFLLCGTSVMCDTMMLAFWVWSVCFWIDGLEHGNRTKLVIAAILITACSLTKYFGLSLIPLLLVYSWFAKRRLGIWLFHLCLPLIVLAAYQWLTFRLYGHGLVGNAIRYATDLRVGGELPSKLLAAFAFTGGCIVLLLAAAPLLWSAKRAAAGLAAMALTGLAVVAMGKVGVVSVVSDGNVDWLFVVQISLLAVAGMSLIPLVATDLLQRKTPDSALLAMWVAGTLVFTSALNWTVSGRNILPMLPAVALLLVRRLETAGRDRGGGTLQRLSAPLGISLLIAMLVARSDYRLANSARDAVSSLHRRLETTANAIQFEGHWGFQYYMEQLGARPLDRRDLRLSRADAIVVPPGNSYLFALPLDRVVPWFEHESRGSRWLATMNGECGAGFYSDGWGPLPYAICSVPAARYLVFRVKGGLAPVFDGIGKPGRVVGDR